DVEGLAVQLGHGGQADAHGAISRKKSRRTTRTPACTCAARLSRTSSAVTNTSAPPDSADARCRASSNPTPAFCHTAARRSRVGLCGTSTCASASARVVHIRKHDDMRNSFVVGSKNSWDRQNLTKDDARGDQHRNPPELPVALPCVTD